MADLTAEDRKNEDQIRAALAGIREGVPVADAIGKALMGGFVPEQEAPS